MDTDKRFFACIPETVSHIGSHEIADPGDSMHFELRDGRVLLGVDDQQSRRGGAPRDHPTRGYGLPGKRLLHVSMWVSTPLLHSWML